MNSSRHPDWKGFCRRDTVSSRAPGRVDGGDVSCGLLQAAGSRRGRRNRDSSSGRSSRIRRSWYARGSGTWTAAPGREWL